MTDNVLETLRLSSPYDILGANIDEATFCSRWSEAQASSPEKLERIAGACSRIQLVEALQYEARIGGLWEQVQSEALQVYLLCTCFDTLAGQDYKHFHDWIKSPEQDELLTKSVGFVEASSLVQWYRTVTQQVAGAWLETYGVTKNYRKLFVNMPDALRQELVDAYAVIKEGETPRGWEALPESKRLRRVVEYLYELRRNKFTHQAVISPTAKPSRGVMGMVCFIPPKVWKYSVYFRDLNDIRGEVSLLRIIAVGQMRHMLGFPVDQNFLKLHWETERVRGLMRRVYAELVHNERAMYIYWRDSSPDLSAQPARGLWRFNVEAAKDLLRQDQINLEWYGASNDREIRSAMSSYVDVIKGLNGLIKEFELLSRNPGTSPEQRETTYERIRSEIRESQLWAAIVQLAGSIHMTQYTPPQIPGRFGEEMTQS